MLWLLLILVSAQVVAEAMPTNNAVGYIASEKPIHIPTVGVRVQSHYIKALRLEDAMTAHTVII